MNPEAMLSDLEGGDTARWDCFLFQSWIALQAHQGQGL